MTWARRSLGTSAAVTVGVIYGLSFGIASAVGFDFHEIAFAVPLLAFCLSALGQGRLGQAAAWALPLVLVKEGLGVTAVAVIGLAPLNSWRPEWILVDPHSTRHYQVSRADEQFDLLQASIEGYAVVTIRDDVPLLRNTR